MQQFLKINQHQSGRLILSPKTRLSLRLLQMPYFELQNEIQALSEKNIFLRPPASSAFYANPEILTYRPSLFEHLIAQAHLAFATTEEYNTALNIIGHIDRNGFLPENFPASPELQIIQTFDPQGIAARSLQETLILQLAEKKESLGYRLVKDFYSDLIGNRMTQIAKATKEPVEKIREEIQKQLAPLALRPARQFTAQVPIIIKPDIIFINRNDRWTIRICQEELNLDAAYVEQCEKESFPRLKKALLEAKWIIKALEGRKALLLKLSLFILKEQNSFFKSTRLKPLTLKKAAIAFKIHESTISRAIAGKYVQLPQGIFPLRYFFSTKVQTLDGLCASQNFALETLKTVIAHENKHKPHSDRRLSDLLKKQGILCQRRTVAKYRHKLNIAPSCYRQK